MVCLRPLLVVLHTRESALKPLNLVPWQAFARYSPRSCDSIFGATRVEQKGTSVAERSPRKLAVILHADVVGSTALVQLDEAIAHERIRDTFHRFSTTIESYNGRPLELRGDALVAEFDRASDAIEASLAFQAENTRYISTLGDEIRPTLRVGISLGEVVVADNTVTGEGIVLAQRLEQLASGGGVCIQGAVYEAVPGRLPFDYDSLGEPELKGITEPVRAYAVRLKPGETIPPPEVHTMLSVPKSESKRPWIVLGTIALLVVVGGGLAWFQPWMRGEEPASIEHMAFPLPDKPSIAVLPFTNMSGNPEHVYFVDGISEDLITDLSKLSGLFVISRNSTFTYRGKSVKVREVAEELGVRYVLEGSVRRVGDQVRINAKLVDAITGGHLWAERYDGAMTDVFALQDRVTRKIVTALAITLTEDEEALRTKMETKSLEAYDAFLEGWMRYQQSTPEDLTKAIEHFKQAIEFDPQYGRAHAALALVYAEGSWKRWLPWTELGVDSPIKWANDHLKRAMTHPIPLAHRAAALVYMIEGRYQEGIAAAERAITLDPNDPSGPEAMARIMLFVGKPERSLEYIKVAQRLDPQTNYLFVVAQAQFQMGQYQDAVETLRRVTQRNPSGYQPFLYLAACYGHLGLKNEAKSAFRALDETYQSYNPDDSNPWRLEQLDRENFSEQAAALIRAGLDKAGIGSTPPEVIEASQERITLRKTSPESPIRLIYESASEHCQRHGKESGLVSSYPPTYEFACY